MWSSVQKLGYMGVTTLYWCQLRLEEQIISFKDVKYPHRKEAIEEALSRCPAD
jgi:hypothetical protein